MSTSLRSLLVVCVSLLLAISAATVTSPCPSQVTEVLASDDYRACQQAASRSSAWVFTQEHAAAIGQSDACLTSLHALTAIDFDACVATIRSDSSSSVVRVAIVKAQLRELSSGLTTTRFLRRVSRSLAEGSTFDRKYLYMGIAACVVLLLICFVLSRGGVICCCIPIPICC